MKVSDMIEIQKKIAPELFELIEKRYNILLNIYYYQPIGRRALANHLKIGERIVRTETIKLQEENLIKILRQGMVVTEKGKIMIERLKELIHETRGLSSMEGKLKSALSLEKVFIVPGNLEKDKNVLDLMGSATANYLKMILKNKMYIGITGGSSVAAVAKEMPRLNLPNTLVIPARGGMGRDAGRQANNIATQLADKLQASYEQLHMPDDVEEEILQALKENHLIKETLEKLKELDVLIYGVGRADEMAQKRELSKEKREFLNNNKAIAEAFGHYFDKEGNVIYKSSSVGISIDDFNKIPYVIAVSGGANKADAIISSCKIRKDLVLVTDESAAQAIIENYI